MNEIYRKPNRLKYFNYSSAGCYFITICTFNRQELFGKVTNSTVVLNEAGKIADKYIKEIPLIYNSIELDEYVIMPTHIHSVLINNNDAEDTGRSKMLISKIIQQYKFVCTREIRKLYGLNTVVWQRSYYDRVVRNEKELEKIRNYIALNPLKWELERDTPENLFM